MIWVGAWGSCPRFDSGVGDGDGFFRVSESGAVLVLDLVN